MLAMRTRCAPLLPPISGDPRGSRNARSRIRCVGFILIRCGLMPNAFALTGHESEGLDEFDAPAVILIIEERILGALKLYRPSKKEAPEGANRVAQHKLSFVLVL
jgi:hypothetical protein